MKSIELEENAELQNELENNLESYTKNGKPFRFNATSVFLTYSQCPISIHDCMDFLNEKSANVLVVAQEKHEDGNTHLHCYVEFKKKMDTKNVRFFDMEGYHPNIAKPISKYYVLKYITKKNDFEEQNIDVRKFLDEEKEHMKKKEKGKVKKTIKMVLDEKITVRQAVDKEPMLLLQYEKLKKNYMLYKNDLKDEERKKNGLCNYNIYKKKRHYWFFGTSNTGKTTGIKDGLKRDYPGDTFEIPRSKFWDGYSGEKILYIDEFKGAVSIQDLNRYCDGDCEIEIKGAKSVLNFRPIVFVLSNYTPKEVYSNVFSENPDILLTIYNRFNIIYLDGYMKFKLIDCDDDPNDILLKNPYYDEISYYENISI